MKMNEKPKKSEPQSAKSAFAGERIAKYLARAGIASRREIERMIEDGRIIVDGKKLASPAINITGKEIILVDGQPVGAPEAPRLWRYHKPAGVLTTNKDPQGRPTVFEKLPPDMPRVVTVGRLDFNTEGLLLLTNDGALARHLELPQNAWLRHYRARVHGAIDPGKIKQLAKGVTIEGIRYEPIKIEVDQEKQSGANQWVMVTIREGKNREVRKVLAHIGLDVTRLIRVAFGPFQLGKLPRGALEEVPPRILKSSLGNFFAASAKPCA